MNLECEMRSRGSKAARVTRLYDGISMFYYTLFYFKCISMYFCSTILTQFYKFIFSFYLFFFFEHSCLLFRQTLRTHTHTYACIANKTINCPRFRFRGFFLTIFSFAAPKTFISAVLFIFPKSNPTHNLQQSFSPHTFISAFFSLLKQSQIVSKFSANAEQFFMYIYM